MIIQNPLLTGSLNYNGADLSNVTSSNANSASVSLILTAVSSSNQQLSASYISLSASYNVFSGSASTRITKIENNYATTGSNSFRADQSITGSLVVSSTITAQTLVVQTVTSSIVYSSGSNLFGNQLTNTQTFTGSVNITGSLALAGNITSNGTAVVLGSGTANYLPKFTGASTIGNSLVFDNGTNVGIGTVTPSDPQGFGGGLDIQNAGYGGVVYLRKSSATTTYGFFGYDQTALAATIAAYGANNKLQFNAGTGAIKMTLDASGNLGLGVTPSAWSGFTALQVGNTAIWSTGTNNSHWSSNTYYNGSDRIYISSDFATEYVQQSGAHKWFIASSGTAGGVITATQAMTLNASGNLGIGSSTIYNGGGFGKVISLYDASAPAISLVNASKQWQLGVSGTNFTMYDVNNFTNVFQLNGSTGAATFYSSVTANDISTFNGPSSNWAVVIQNTNSGSGTSYGLKVKAGTSGATDATFVLQDYAGNEFFTARGNGRIGIGTNSPDQKFTIQASGGYGLISYKKSDATTTAYVGISDGAGNIISTSSAGDLCLRVDGTNAILFSSTGNAERMRITSGGNVGIGESSPLSLLQVGGIGNSSVRLGISSTTSTSATYSFVAWNSSGSDILGTRGDGLVYAPFIYSTFTTGAAANMGIDSAGGFYRSVSSIKYKKNVEDYTKGLAEVMQIRPVFYNSINEKEDGILYAGLIAEEVHELGLTEFVQYAEDGSPDALAYQNMIALAFKAIQEQQAIITSLQEQINELKAR